MTPEEIKELVIRVDCFADGIKNGSQLFAKALVDKLNENSSKAAPVKPPEEPAGN